MDKWKVYISSTFKDLKEYRLELINLFQNQLKNSFELNEIMERMFDDGTYTPFVDDCVEAVLNCDIYIIILGNKTGSYPPNEKRTYTEIEFDHALANNKLIFCLRIENFDENEIDNKEKHDAILKKFEGRPIHSFNNSISLSNHIFKFLFPYASQLPPRIKDYFKNDEFRKFLIKLSESNNIQNYCNLTPFIFGNIIRAMDVDNRNKEFEKYRKFGNERYWLIKEYFDSYLNLSKYCILSILWDEIRTDSIDTQKQSIYELVVTSKMDENNIDTLSKLCDEIHKKFGKKKEKAFIESLMPSLELFKVGISIFDKHDLDEKSYWKAEKLLQQLMVCSKFLNQYQIRSIRARYYIRHRNDVREQYSLEYSNKQNELFVVEEAQVNENFMNIHSLYLCQKEKGGDIVINLSPFYFDKNSHDPTSAKIKLFSFDRIKEEDGSFSLNYLPIFNPREKGSKMSNSNIEIAENKITSEQLLDAESIDNKLKLERELKLHKINKLYEQFIPFLNVIAKDHA